MNTYNKLQKKFLIWILIEVVITFALLVFLLFLPLEFNVLMPILFVVLLIGLILSLVLKSKFDYYNFLYRHSALFENLAPAVETNQIILSQSWFEMLKKEKYQLYKSYGGYSIYYKIDNGPNNKRAFKTLYIVVAIADNSLSFENEIIEKSINKLEMHLYKNAKYSQRIIYQFKSDKKFTQELAKSTNMVLFARNHKQNIVLINVYHFLDDHVAYFVHSTTNPPTPYYDFATKHLIDLLHK